MKSIMLISICGKHIIKEGGEEKVCVCELNTDFTGVLLIKWWFITEVNWD